MNNNTFKTRVMNASTEQERIILANELHEEYKQNKPTPVFVWQTKKEKEKLDLFIQVANEQLQYQNFDVPKKRTYWFLE